MLDKLLQDWSWQGGWQQERIVEGERILGRGRSLVGSLEDCRWQELWRQNGDVEGGIRLMPRSSLGSCGKCKMAR